VFIHNLINLPELDVVTTDTGRHYITPKGNVYPSVTTVLSILPKEGLDQWRKRVGEDAANKKTRMSARRGEAVHGIFEDYLNNKENPIRGHMPLNVELFLKTKPLVDGHIDNILGTEVPLYSDYLRTAGRCDLIAKYDGINSIIDYKTKEYAISEDWAVGYFMQEAAYSVMFEERTGIPIPQLVIIIAVENDKSQILISKRSEFINRFINLRSQYDDQIIT